jgi:hypothetical protein
MTDWIEEKAARIKERQDQAENERQSGVHEADVIYAKGREVLEQLETVVRADVEKWNANFPNDVRQRIDSVGKSIPNGFVVHKTGYPAATLHADFDPASMSIKFSAVKRRAIGEGEYIAKGLFNLKLSDEGAIYLTNRSGELFSFEDASRQLLEAVLDT